MCIASVKGVPNLTKATIPALRVYCRLDNGILHTDIWSCIQAHTETCIAAIQSIIVTMCVCIQIQVCHTN